METKFNSQICTTREQSERLLALGLKKETADMTIVGVFIGTNEDGTLAFEDVPNAHPPMLKKDIPAWSLDRLMKLVPHRYGEYCEYANNFMYYYNIPLDVVEQFIGETKYEYLLDCIEWLIKEGYFNKEYLV